MIWKSLLFCKFDSCFVLLLWLLKQDFVYRINLVLPWFDRQLKNEKTFDANGFCDSHSATSDPSHCSLSLAVVPYQENIIADFHHKERIFAFPGNHHVTIKQNWNEGGVASVVWDAVSAKHVWAVFLSWALIMTGWLLKLYVEYLSSRVESHYNELKWTSRPCFLYMIFELGGKLAEW